jgi:hypothetical protein
MEMVIPADHEEPGERDGAGSEASDQIVRSPQIIQLVGPVDDLAESALESRGPFPGRLLLALD